MIWGVNALCQLTLAFAVYVFPVFCSGTGVNKSFFSICVAALLQTETRNSVRPAEQKKKL